MSDSLSIATSALQIAARAVPWDSESFGVAVAQIDACAVHEAARAALEARDLYAWLHQRPYMLASCRLEESRLAECHLLEALGFRFVEMVYGMRCDLASFGEVAEPDPDWQRATDADLPALTEMATDAFKTGRWNVDPRVGSALGGARYADWVRRSLSDPRHEVWLARERSQPAAFFIVEVRPGGAMYWHLTAVSPKFQGQGIGKRLWRSMCERHRRAGGTSIETTISSRNLPVLNLYARMGWRFVANHLTLHWVHPDWRAP